MDMPSFFAGFIAGVAAVGVVLLPVGVAIWLARPWLRMYFSGGRGSFFELMGMRFRGTPLWVVDAYVSLLHSGEIVSLREVESCYIANRASVFDSRDLLERLRKRGSK